jgi:hypothetical protein
MTPDAPAVFKIPTESPQLTRGKPARTAARATARRPATGRVLANGAGRTATRGGGEVIELEHGIVVYPARSEGGRWRAVWHEDGRRQQCEASSEEKLAAKLEKVTERLTADAPNMRRPGADLIAWYLNPDRFPVNERWSRKHAHTQRRLCERFAAPVIGAVTCQDIKTSHTQAIVNAAPTAGEGNRVRGMISALVSAGESALWVDPAEIPSDDDVARLGQALGTGLHGERDELMAITAAYSGLRWGELTALTIPQVKPAGRVITVDRKVVEAAGHLYVEAPKNRKFRRTVYPRRTPAGYPVPAGEPPAAVRAMWVSWLLPSAGVRSSGRSSPGRPGPAGRAVPDGSRPGRGRPRGQAQPQQPQGQPAEHRQEGNLGGPAWSFGVLAAGDGAGADNSDQRVARQRIGGRRHRPHREVPPARRGRDHVHEHRRDRRGDVQQPRPDRPAALQRQGDSQAGEYQRRRVRDRRLQRG